MQSMTEIQTVCSTVSSGCTTLGAGLGKLATVLPVDHVESHGSVKQLARLTLDFAQAIDDLGQNLVSQPRASLDSETRADLTNTLSQVEELLTGMTKDLDRALSGATADSYYTERLLSTTLIWEVHVEHAHLCRHVLQSHLVKWPEAARSRRKHAAEIDRSMAIFRQSHLMPRCASEARLPQVSGEEESPPGYEAVMTQDARSSSPPEQRNPPLPPRYEARTDSHGSDKSGTRGFFEQLFKALNRPGPLTAPLCHASQSGNVSQMKGLLVQGANINGHNEVGDTPLIVAIEADQIEAVRFLLDNGASANTKDFNKHLPPLFHAAGAGQINVMNLLIQHGADVHAIATMGTPYFIHTVEKGSIAAVSLLLRHGANPNARSMIGQPVIATAIQGGRLQVVQTLLESGADISVTLITGQSLMSEAIRVGNPHLCRLLLAHGASSNSRAMTGESCLSMAESRNDITTVRHLLAAGADPNGRDIRGNTALVNSVVNGHFEITQLLLARKADPSAKDYMGRSVLAIAVWEDKLTFAEALITHGASPDVSGLSGMHLLTLLFQKNHSEEELARYLRVFLRHGVDPNKQVMPRGYVANMPLGYCIQHDRLELLRILLQNGANPLVAISASPRNPDTPMDYAQYYQKAEALQLMKAYHTAGKRT